MMCHVKFRSLFTALLSLVLAALSFPATGAETRPANGSGGGVSITAAYDGYGRLTSYARTGEPSLSHAYNGMDDRVATTRTPAGGSADTRRFLYAPDGRVLGEYGANALDVKAEFIWMSPMVGDSGAFGGDDGLGGYMPLAVASNDSQGVAQLTWVHASHMGVPIRYSDASGNTLTAPTSYSVPGFPGQSATFADLYYNRYRDYDTTTGRYIQADPIGLAGGPSPYSYALNNPLKYSDPDGKFAFLLPAAAGVGRLALQCALNPVCRAGVAALLTYPLWPSIGDEPLSIEGKFCPEPSAMGGVGGGMAISSNGGGGNDCAVLVQKIKEIRDELARRKDEYKLDPLGLPEGPGRNTRIGHVQQFKNKQAQLRRLLLEAITKGCTGYPLNAWRYASGDI